MSSLSPERSTGDNWINSYSKSYYIAQKLFYDLSGSATLMMEQSSKHITNSILVFYYTFAE